MNSDPQQTNTDGATGGADTGGSATGKAGPQADLQGLLASWRRDFLIALAFFTRLPVKAPTGSLAGASRAFPLAGLIIGLGGALAYYLAIKLGLSDLLAALLAVTASACITGALHEDGLADLCDALGAKGGDNPESGRLRRLEVLRDSRLGSFGALGLILGTGLKVAALAALGSPEFVAGALVATHALARGVLPQIMARMSLAREDGLAAGAGKPSAADAAWALGVAFAVAVFAVAPIAALVGLLAACAAAFLIAKLAQRKFGGYTGDVLGTAEQLAEMAILINLVTLT
jgi:adenosylcobinamide-GDP ribazoletransferase